MRMTMYRVVNVTENKVVANSCHRDKTEQKLAELKKANPDIRYALSCKWFNL